MCLTKTAFDTIYKKASSKAKRMKRKADRKLWSLSYRSPEEEVREYLRLRKQYLNFVHGDRIAMNFGGLNGR